VEVEQRGGTAQHGTRTAPAHRQAGVARGAAKSRQYLKCRPIDTLDAGGIEGEAAGGPVKLPTKLLIQRPRLGNVETGLENEPRFACLSNDLNPVHAKSPGCTAARWGSLRAGAPE
jgi:hypothetical protein